MDRTNQNQTPILLQLDYPAWRLSFDERAPEAPELTLDQTESACDYFDHCQQREPEEEYWSLRNADREYTYGEYETDAERNQ